jgi:hypothetical protein
MASCESANPSPPPSAPTRQPKELNTMCRRVTCPNCNKATFAGCGAHVEQVLAGVAPDQRCTCQGRASPPREGDAKRKGWWPFG